MRIIILLILLILTYVAKSVTVHGHVIDAVKKKEREYKNAGC